MAAKPRILFLCGDNSCRSQMAEGLVNKLWSDRAEAMSAGLTAKGLHPKAVEAAREIDIDITSQKSKTLKQLGVQNFDLVVSLCLPAKEYCLLPDLGTDPAADFEKRALFVGNPAHLHWAIDDPAEAPGDGAAVTRAFRAARDALREEIRRLFESGYFSALVGQRTQLAEVADLLDDGLAIHDQNRRFYVFNKAAEKLTGCSRDEALGRECHQVFPPGGLCGGECQFKELGEPLAEGGGRREYRISFTNREGLEKKLLVRSAPISVGHGFPAVLASFRDVTEVTDLRWRLEARHSFHGMVGMSKAMQDVFTTIRSVASSDYPVLITGESGTGKELVSSAIHGESPRKGGPFVPVNCGALPENILESELFGHVRGAFTGAIKDKKGRFELANGGTMFLDEVGELPLAFQVKLLRVLQGGSFERVGGEKPIQVDVRIIAATNQDLKTMVEAGRFREDLYYRLCVVPISLPPLRERVEDIPLLIDLILKERIKEETGKPVLGVESDALELILSYPWPGNIRELINALQFASVRCDGDKIRAQHLPPDVQNRSGLFRGSRLSSAPAGAPEDPPERKTKLDIAKVERALADAGGNKVKAARLLGVGRATLYRFLKDRPL